MIISLVFAMEVLATERDRYSSTQEWKCETKKKFEPPQVTLVVANWISWHSSPCILLKEKNTFIVMVQKDTPNNLLLGTDTLLCLGFTLLQKDLDTHGVNLISGEKYVLDKEKPSHQQEVEVVTKPL